MTQAQPRPRHRRFGRRADVGGARQEVRTGSGGPRRRYDLRDGRDDGYVEPGRRPGTGRAVIRLSARLVRRGAILLALAVGVYAATEVIAYLATYPDAASRANLTAFQDNPAVRIIQGIPHGLDTRGGFFSWDAGWILEGITGVWGILVTSRLLRGEEDADRAGLVLAAPLRAARVTALQLLVVAGASVLLGVTVVTALVATGTGAAGSVLFAASLVGFTATFAGISAVTAQVMGTRRRVVGAAAGVLGVLFLVRMAANSADSRGWLRWLTPFGWMDEVRPYTGPRPVALALLLTAPLALAGAAVALRRRRDTGGALVTGSDRRPPHLRMLGGPARFAWRGTRAVLAGWVVGLGAYALMVGLLVRTLTELVGDDAGYRGRLEALGMDLSDVTKAVVSLMGATFGIGFALYASWRVGAARAEEDTSRIDHVLARPVTRRHWLGGHALMTLVASVVLTATTGLAMWAGAALDGAGVTAGDVMGAFLNTVPTTAVFAGLAVLTYGALPRFTVGVPVTAVVVSYLVQTLGETLDWPFWVMDVSPFHHVANVPSEPVAVTPAVVMVAVGLAAMLAGLVAFERRDLVGE